MLACLCELAGLLTREKACRERKRRSDHLGGRFGKEDTMQEKISERHLRKYMPSAWNWVWLAVFIAAMGANGFFLAYHWMRNEPAYFLFIASSAVAFIVIATISYKLYTHHWRGFWVKMHKHPNDRYVSYEVGDVSMAYDCSDCSVQVDGSLGSQKWPQFTVSGYGESLMADMFLRIDHDGRPLVVFPGTTGIDVEVAMNYLEDCLLSGMSRLDAESAYRTGLFFAGENRLLAEEITSLKAEHDRVRKSAGKAVDVMRSVEEKLMGARFNPEQGGRSEFQRELREELSQGIKKAIAEL